jgi:hypothetical protein
MRAVIPNEVYLERATGALRGHGHLVVDTLLQYLSPLGWEHINLTDEYPWRNNAKVGARKFRPRRPLPTLSVRFFPNSETTPDRHLATYAGTN